MKYSITERYERLKAKIRPSARTRARRRAVQKAAAPAPAPAPIVIAGLLPAPPKLLLLPPPVPMPRHRKLRTYPGPIAIGTRVRLADEYYIVYPWHTKVPAGVIERYIKGRNTKRLLADVRWGESSALSAYEPMWLRPES